MSTDNSLEDLKSKIRTLKFRMGKSDGVIAKRDKEALERQRLSVSTISTMVNTLKETLKRKCSLREKPKRQ